MLSGSLVTRTGSVCIVWELGYMNWWRFHRLWAGLRDQRLIALFGGSVTQTGGVASSGGSSTQDRAAGMVWGLGYVTEISSRT